MAGIIEGKYWDKPWSLVDGCTPCSPGCEHCWSAAMTHRFNKEWLPFTNDKGQFYGKIATHPERLSIPLKQGLRRRKPTVYAIWNDLFHEEVKEKFIAEAWDVMTRRLDHTFLVLTKRPQQMLSWANSWKLLPFRNIYLGLTVCNQQEADEKIPIFLRVPGKKFLSIEPMLSEVSLRWLKLKSGGVDEYDGLRLFDAVILGAETGPGARPMDLEWARIVRDECAEAGVPFFLKQTDKKRNRLLDGRAHDDLPWR